MMGRQSGLGRGLGALIPPRPANPPAYQPSTSPSAHVQASVVEPGEAVVRPNTHEIHYIPLDKIDPNPHQPRVHFDHEQLEDLISSIRAHGVMQPITVTPKSDGRYELIAGERRLRASKIAGMGTIPSIVRTANEQQKLELALIENVQRQDLNPLEEARAYLQLQHEFGLTQEEVSMRAGKSRSQVANTIRLLQLPREIQDGLEQGKISASNARTILSLPTDDERVALYHVMLEGNFTVRQTEARVPHARSKRSNAIDPNLLSLEETLRNALGAKVAVKRGYRGDGEIKITFTNDEDLKSIVEKISASRP